MGCGEWGWGLGNGHRGLGTSWTYKLNYDFRLRTVDFGLFYFELWTLDSGVWTLDLVLENREWRMVPGELEVGLGT